MKTAFPDTTPTARRSPADGADRRDAASPPVTRTIVHADDSGSVRRWVAEQLGDLNVKIVSFPDGQAALAFLKESACDLLLTDLEMPHLDGLGLLAAVRELPSHRFLPILVLSSKQAGEFPLERRQGVTGWLVKPVDPEHLRRWVRRALA